MNVRIRPLMMEDYEVVLRWSKNDDFCSANGWERNRDVGELRQWWHNCVNNPPADFVRMGIEYDEKLVGYTDLACIKENTAELGIAIGESTLWGNGIGFHASKCMLNYALKLGITSLDAETHETNHRSRRMLEKLGFEEISRIGTEDYMESEAKLIQYKLVLKPRECS